LPAAFEYIFDDRAGDYRSLEEAFAKEAIERQKRFEKHWNYYDGVMPSPLKVEGDGYNDNVILAKVDQVADKVLSFLLGDGVTFDVGADDQETEDDDAVAALWAANRGATLQHNIALSGILTGHCVVRIEPMPGGQMPRIVHVNAAQFSTFWDVSDIDNVLWYRLQYRLGANGLGKRIDYVKGRQNGQSQSFDHTAGGWTEIVYRIDGMGTQWKQVNLQVLPFDFPPIVDWQNMPRPHTYYGADDISRAVALNDALNFVASNYQRILKHHGSPKTIGIGFDAEAIVGTSVGGFYTVNKSKSEADIFNLEMQSDLSSAREFLGILAREIWQSARMVDPQMVKDTVGSLTNFGLKVLFSDALSKTNTKRLLYGEAYELIAKRGLVMAGLAAPDKVKTNWPDVLPEDSLAVSTALLKEVEAGLIDKETYRQLRGYDNDVIEQRLSEEQAGQQNLGALLLSNFSKGA
jgi:hypothetical protein